ncbi:hypothetical protein B0O99DRAFT_152305 [Bisporella sp. PMI_857]|nr:hypothetical protein B0O99DRAFT_152305 [Bisporella sp. PMI_857]
MQGYWNTKGAKRWILPIMSSTATQRLGGQQTSSNDSFTSFRRRPFRPHETQRIRHHELGGAMLWQLLAISFIAILLIRLTYVLTGRAYTQPIHFPPSNQRIQVYAPLYNCLEYPEGAQPYEVVLVPGHFLKQHSEVIGKDICLKVNQVKTLVEGKKRMVYVVAGWMRSS